MTKRSKSTARGPAPTVVAAAIAHHADHDSGTPAFDIVSKSDGSQHGLDDTGTEQTSASEAGGDSGCLALGKARAA